MSWVLTIFVAILTLSHLSEASHHRRKLPSAVVVGTVYCDTCFQENLAKTSHFISGASVAVECKYGSNPKPIFQQEVKTDNHGEFKVHLPFAVSKHVKNIEGCSVKLISSSEPYCAVASTATSSSLHLKSRKEGTHIFSAGFFTFKPQKQPTLCNQKPTIQNSRDLSSKIASLHSNPDFTFPPPLQDLPAPGLVPGLPNLPPLPQLPPLPPLPGVPNFPPTFQGKQKAETKNTQSSKDLSSKKASLHSNPDFTFPPPLQDLPAPGLVPGLPNLPPLPQLPPLPPLPGVPNFPPTFQGKQKAETKATKSSKDLSSKKASLHSNPDFTFPPPLQDLPAPGLVPGLPNLPPLPQLPPLPPLPGVPNFPPTFQGKQTAETKTTQSPTTPNTYQKEARRDTFFPPIFPPLIPNPFQPPPLIPNPFQPPPLIPNPFQPPPAPIIPNPFQPPPAAPSPIFPFPPIPGLTPSPPPPPPTFHFPSFPFPPLFPPFPPKTPPKHSSPSP